MSVTDRAYARTSDPGTSHEAAEAVTPSLSRVQRVVMAILIDAREPLTDEQIEARYRAGTVSGAYTRGISGQALRTQRKYLRDRGAVETLSDRTATNRAGRRVALHVATGVPGEWPEGLW